MVLFSRWFIRMIQELKGKLKIDLQMTMRAWRMAAVLMPFCGTVGIDWSAYWWKRIETCRRLGKYYCGRCFVGNIYCGCSLSFSLSFVIVRCAWQLLTSTQTRCTGTGAAGTKCCWQPPPTKWMPFTKARSGKVFRPYVVSFWFWLHKFNIFNFLPNNSQIQWRTKHCKCVPF